MLRSLIARHAALAVFLVALTVRLVYFAQAADDELFSLPLLDERTYHDIAIALTRDGFLYDHRPFWQEPLYPYLLGALYALVGPSVAAGKLVNALIGSGSAALLVLVGRRLFDARVGLVAGLGLALYGTAIFCDGQLLSGSLVLALHLLLLWVTLRVLDDPRPVRAIALGVTSALVILAKANGALVVLAVALLVGRRVGWRRLAPLALGLGVGLLPSVVRNRVRSGEWVVVSSNGGFNLYLGNNEDAVHTERLRPGAEMDALVNEPVRLGLGEAAAQSRWFVGRTLTFVRSHPLDEARLLAKKTYEYFWGEEIPRNQRIDPAAKSSWLFAALYGRRGVAWPAGIVIPLALVGLGLLVRARHDVALLAIVLLAEVVSVVPFFVTERYRLPAVPIFLLLASWLIVHLAHTRGRALVPPIIACAGLIWACNLGLEPMRDTYDADTYYNAAVQLQAAERWREADALYAQALAQDSRFLMAHAGRAMVAWHEGRLADAQRAFEAALALGHPAELLREAARFYALRGDDARAGALEREAR